MHRKKSAMFFLAVFVFSLLSAFSFAQNNACAGESFELVSANQAYSGGITTTTVKLKNTGSVYINGTIGWELYNGSRRNCTEFLGVAPGTIADYPVQSNWCSADGMVSVFASTSCGAVAKKQLVDAYTYASISIDAVNTEYVHILTNGRVRLDINLSAFSRSQGGLISCNAGNIAFEAIGTDNLGAVPHTCGINDLLYVKVSTQSDKVYDVKPMSSDVFKLVAGNSTPFKGYQVKLTTVQASTPNIAYFDVVQPDGTTVSKSVQAGSNDTLGGVNVRVYEAGQQVQYPTETALAIVSLSVANAAAACGNGICESGESSSCPADCAASLKVTTIGSAFDKYTTVGVKNTGKIPLNATVFGFSKSADKLVLCSNSGIPISVGAEKEVGISCTLTITDLLYFKVLTQISDIYALQIPGDAYGEVHNPFAGVKLAALPSLLLKRVQAGTPTVADFEVTMPDGTVVSKSIKTGSSDTVGGLNIRVYDTVFSAQPFIASHPDSTSMSIISISNSSRVSVPSSPVVACSDSDGGRDYYTPGTAKGVYGGVNGFSTDYCSEGKNSAGLPVNLVEFYCTDSQNYTSYPYYCQNGCSNGACIAQAANATQACTDSDGGKNYNVKGSASPSAQNVEGRVDCCKSEYSTNMGDSVAHIGPGGGPCVSEGTYLYEAACGSDGIPTTTVYSCPQGCKDGACVSASSDAKCMNFYYYEGRFDQDIAKQICADVENFDWKSRGWPEHPSGKRGDESIDGWKHRVSGQAGVLEISLATDKSSYSLGDAVRISAKTQVSGSLVGASLQGKIVREGSSEEELFFSSPVQPGIYNVVYEPKGEGVYYFKATAAYSGSVAESSAKFFVGAKKNAELYVWLGNQNYDYNPGDSLKIFAKLVDRNVGEPILGADVYAKVYWAGTVRPQQSQTFGGGAAAPTGYAVAGIASALEKQIAPATDESAALVEAPYPRMVVVDVSKDLKRTLKLGYPAGGIANDKVEYAGYTVELADVAVSGSACSAKFNVFKGGAGMPSVELQNGGTVHVSDLTIYMGACGKEYASGLGYPSDMAPAVTITLNSPQGSSQPASASASKDVIKLEYNPSSRYYQGTYAIPPDARSGTYKVSVRSQVDAQDLRESTSFSVGESESYLSFESGAKQAASEGRYGDCRDYYLKAAQRVGAYPRRLVLDIEKAGICARLGSLPNSFYSDAGKIVEDTEAYGLDKYVLFGVASQYYELGGNYRKSRELLEAAAAGIEGIQEKLPEEKSATSKLILAKYYSLLGKEEKAAAYNRMAAEFFAAGNYNLFLKGLFAAGLYAKAGDSGSAKKQYLSSADWFSDYETSGGEAILVAFLSADAYEKAGEAQKAEAQYKKAVGSIAPKVSSGEMDLFTSDADNFFTYSAKGRSYERLGEKEEAREQYENGLERLLLKDAPGSSYFAAGLSGYLGDYAKAKELCRKTFEESLSEDSSLEKLTFMNAYCYSILGDSVRAKKGCDLYSILPEIGPMAYPSIFEPLSPPVSYCSQSSEIRSSACGNSIVDAGETSENCCADTGCAFGDTCSKALNKCVKPVKEIPQETILEVLMRLEDVRIKLDTLEGKALAISKYYEGKEQSKYTAWTRAANVFRNAKSKVDDINKGLKAGRDKITEDSLEDIRLKLDGVRGSLKEAVDAILEVPVFKGDFDLDNFVLDYNRNLDRVPSFVKALFGNERINAHINLNNGSEMVFGGITENGKIVEAKKGGIENASMDIFISESAIRDIRSAKDRAKALQDALDSKEISYTSASLASEAKLSVATRAYNLVSKVL